MWEFTKQGSAFHSGVLNELRSGHKPQTTEYTYCPCDRLLYIDRYRVMRIRWDEYWLYDLEDVKTEPDDYRFQMKIKKM